MAKIAALCGAMLISASAFANVTYRWVGDETNVGYQRDVKIQMILSDKNSYGGFSESCTQFGAHPCAPQPGIDLVSFSFGVNYFWMTLDPQVRRLDGTAWDISVNGFGSSLVGRIDVSDFSDNIRMSSVGNLWTISRIGSDRGLALENVTGRFEVVPEPSVLLLVGIALAGLIGFRRKQF